MMLGSGLWMGFGWLWMLALISLPIAAAVLVGVALARSARGPKEG